MDGYELQAQSYEEYLKKHPETDAIVREEIERKIRCLRAFVGTTVADRDAMFNTGAFNSICKGYITKAVQNCKLPDDTIDAVLEEFNFLLDTMTASDARASAE